MTDEEYMQVIGEIRSCIHTAPVSGTFLELVRRWVTDVLPVKHKEYGIDCWLLLGPRALCADLSACYFRIERLLELGRTAGDESLDNALVDMIGYCFIYTACVLQPLGDVGFFMNVVARRMVGQSRAHERLVDEIWRVVEPDYAYGVQIAWDMALFCVEETGAR